MKFEDLPHDVQVVAVQTLSNLMQQTNKEPALLAKEVKDAFVYLHEDQAINTTVRENSYTEHSMAENRFKAWGIVIAAARLAQLASQSDDYEKIKRETVNAILAAFDGLGLLPPFPDMRYELMAECGHINNQGEMSIVSPMEMVSSGFIKAVIFEPQLRDTSKSS